MLHNGNYYNNYWPYNMYSKSAPFNFVEKNVETSTEIENNKNLEKDAPDRNETSNSKEDEFNAETSNKNRLSLFGFSLNLDDIIIIAIIIFLFMENKKDYLLLIILGLMLFDISTDTFKNMNIVKQLFNPT